MQSETFQRHRNKLNFSHFSQKHRNSHRALSAHWTSYLKLIRMYNVQCTVQYSSVAVMRASRVASVES